MKTTSERAVQYGRARPAYAAQVVPFVQEKTGRRRFDAVVDIGSGTGLSAKLFASCARQVIGIEPNDAMRQAAKAVPPVRFVRGHAESTGLPAGQTDLLVAASCLEWCDPVQALAEFRRVLVVSGFVVALWNHRRITDRVSWEFDQLWHRHMGPRIGPDDGDLDKIARWYLDPEPQTLLVLQHVRFDRQRLQDFALSSSYAPRRHHARRLAALNEDLDRFYINHAGTELTLPFESVCYVGHLRAAG